jgi:autotransporter translocation and assembly factor TamB
VYRQGFRVPPNGALRGALQWRGDLAEIGALIPPSDHLIAGPGLVDLNLAGTVADPIVSGDLTVTNGRYDHLAFGTILTNLTIRSQLADNADNDAIALIFSADDGSTGTIAGNAKVSLFSGFAVNASAVIDRAVLLRRDDISARLSGQTEVTGNVNDLLIAADLKVDGAEVDLGQTGGPTIVDLGQMYDTEDDADALIETGMTSSTFRATLDINIESPEGIHIFGRGLTSEWSMGLAVAGDAAAPTITGEIRQISGHLDLLGARFDLSRGALRFTGAPDAALDILFTRRADSVRGGIVVSGRASDPQVNFASSPSLAPSEVLPRVIFGHPQQALSPAQTAQLAAGIATLVTGKSGVAGFVAGIGRVDVGTNGLNAGRYVGDGVYVGARQNDDGSGGAVVIELEVIDDVILDAETSQFGGSSVGVSWRHDF